MQRITWDASAAAAKACKLLTGSMPQTFQNRVLKAAQYAYDVCCSSSNDESEHTLCLTLLLLLLLLSGG